eukprot:TRINITY_DN543_c0_g1_i1.p1 TRINITY_DN543_c0_g1~~TRINITY_DN543_c0_g1_i1.p1  ORF type:complete len:345 (+),score=87.80 TRINITY_DN543_c0_g1_i1:118-1152(+)
MDVTLAHSIHNAFSRFSQPYHGENRNFVIAGTAVAVGASLIGIKLFMKGRSNQNRPNLSGKIALVTGASLGGIGYETAKELALLGARVIITVRDQKKGMDAVAALKKATNKSDIDYVIMALDDLSSVRSTVKFLEQTLGDRKIDLLINNAGVMACPLGRTKDGFETQFGTNHIGHYAFTVLLLNANLIANTGRIITVSSMASLRGKLDLTDPSWTKKPYSSWQAYSDSKLHNVLFARELQERLLQRKSDIISVSLHPGAVNTDLGRHLGWAWATLAQPLRFFFKSANDGAQTTLHCATTPDLYKYGGEYFDNCGPATPHPAASENAPSRKLWELTENWTNIRLN